MKFGRPGVAVITSVKTDRNYQFVTYSFLDENGVWRHNATGAVISFVRELRKLENTAALILFDPKCPQRQKLEISCYFSIRRS